MRIKLICIDADGTLLDSAGTVPAGVWQAVENLRRRGVRLALCSGRPAFGITRDYAERLDADGWHIFQNGASVVQPGTGMTDSVALPPDVVRDLIRRSRERGLLLELYGDFEYAVERDADRTRRHAALLGQPFRTRPFESLAVPVVRGQWLIAHDERDSILADAPAGLNVCPSLAPTMADTTFMNMTAAGIDKGSALRAVATAYGIALDRVMMIGDGDNDVGALRLAGQAVAMGNASEAARAVAHTIVKHVDEGGLLQALALAEE
jgi:Cof subfamily protein (haloacid dehalogenase superfamily)